jgi:hypothetical protein
MQILFMSIPLLGWYNSLLYKGRATENWVTPYQEVRFAAAGAFPAAHPLLLESSVGDGPILDGLLDKPLVGGPILVRCRLNLFGLYHGELPLLCGCTVGKGWPPSCMETVDWLIGSVGFTPWVARAVSAVSGSRTGGTWGLATHSSQ